MVKKGTKRKIEIKKITNKYSLATSFTKRSYGLYSKASQLCLLSDAQIAILATPSSSNSNVPFFSFGHSSVEAVVSAFLSGESLAPLSIMETKEMREDLGVCMARSDLGLGHWWDDEERFRNPQEIMEAIESIKSLLSHVKRLRKEDAVNVIDQTLTNGDDTAERDQILSNSNTFCNNNNNNDLSPPAATRKLDEWSDMDIDQLLNDIDDKLPENHTTEEEDHHQTSDNLCNNNNALLPDNQTQGEEDHQIVAVSANLCSNNNNALLPENQTQGEEYHQIVAVSENLCSNNNNALLPDNQTQGEEDHQIVAVSENLGGNNNALGSMDDNLDEFAGKLDEWSDMDLDQILNDIDDELPENHTTEEEDHHQTSDYLCNNPLLPAGNMDDDDDELLEPEMDLDFKTIFERMSDKDLDEFAATFMS